MHTKFRLVSLKRLYRKPRHRWEENIKTDLKEMRWECVTCIYLAQEGNQCWALVKMVMNLQVPYEFENILTS
jgi:hypothetical protein